MRVRTPRKMRPLPAESATSWERAGTMRPRTTATGHKSSSPAPSLLLAGCCLDGIWLDEGLPANSSGTIEWVEIVVAMDDPRQEDIRGVVALHLAFARGTTPSEFAFALDFDELLGPDITFFSARRDGRVVAIAALKRLDHSHVELKSMHTRQDERNLGIGRSMLQYL